jgi:VanZ family protein
MPLLRAILFPPRWMRLLALNAFALVAANLLWHGTRPYAVGAVPAPWDLVAHMVLYACFSGTAWVMLGGGRWTADMLAPMAAIGLGVLDEFAQTFNPGRHADLGDLAADAAGAIVAAVLLASARHALSGSEHPGGGESAAPGLASMPSRR